MGVEEYVNVRMKTFWAFGTYSIHYFLDKSRI